MGMSASQARLLSITSRLTNNEFRAQTITNSKLRLATESQEASQKYMDALSSKKLVFGQYDANGDKTYTPLTANVLLSYGDLKNQYAMVNTNGQILLSGSDIKTYMAANGDYLTYMKLNGVNTVTVDNDEYAEQLQTILGAEWAEYLTEEDATTVGDVQTKLGSYLNSINNIAGVNLTYSENADGEKIYSANITKAAGTISSSFDIPEASNTLTTTTTGNYTDGNIVTTVTNLFGSSQYNAAVKNLSTLVLGQIPDLVLAGGVTGGYASSLMTPPKWIGDFNFNVPEPQQADYTKDVEVHPSLWELWQNAVANGGCWDAANERPSGTDDYHCEHILTHMLTPGTTYKTSNGQTFTMPNDANGHTSVNGQSDSNWPNESEEAAKKVRAKLGTDSSNINGWNANNKLSELAQNVVDLYFDAVLKCGKSGSISASGTTYVGDENAIAGRTSTLMLEFKAAATYETVPDPDAYKTAHEEWEKQLAKAQTEWMKNYSNLKTKVNEWINSFKDLSIKVQKAIDKLGEPTQEVPDEKDAKFQWYTNLWYRMGGGAKVGHPEELDKSNFAELDENLINNSEWLKFALEHGIITLEQATFFEDGSAKYPDMGQYDWVSKAYTNAVDIVSQDDEVAIAIAEVKYKNTITEIENKDKKYDQDLKKLDTEHNALQTEYESIKEVITKNVERSFKAFS